MCVRRSRIIDEEIVVGEVGSAVLISVGEKYREWQDAVYCRKSVSKRNACDIEGRCVVRRTLVCVALLEMQEGFGSLGNEGVELDDSVRTRS